MARSLLFFVFFVAVSYVNAQHFNQMLNSADEAYKSQNYQVAASRYDSAFLISTPGEGALYNAACAHSLAGNKQKAIAYLEKALAQGQEFDWAYYDTDLDPIRQERDYLLLEAKYRSDSAVYFDDIVRMLQQNSEITLTNQSIRLPENYEQFTLPAITKRWGFEAVDSSLSFPNRTLAFDHCKFPDREGALSFLRVKSLVFSRSEGEQFSLVLSHMQLSDLIFLSDSFSEIDLMNVHLEGVFQCYPKKLMRLSISNCEWVIDRYSDSEINAISHGPGRFHNGVSYSGRLGQVSVSNLALTSHSDLLVFEFDITTDLLRMTNSHIDHGVFFKGSADYLNVKGNRFTGDVDFFGFKFPEYNCYIPFSQFEGNMVRFTNVEPGEVTTLGDSLEHFGDPEVLEEVVSVYKDLYNNYRNRGALVSANLSYVKLKELEIAHLQRKPERTSEETIRLRINQLMGFYTDHGTSPGKAVIISFYLILAFAGLFFFFPSEWDKQSKEQMIADFRLFVEKNEHGYFRPFLKMIGNILLSFANAVTLSMNAFVTLGFGAIPTTGLARYVCIFEGLLGWFLLSLFTVALINQVLL